MNKLLSIILAAVGVLMPMNLWAQEVADEMVYEPYFNFEDNNLVINCDTEGASIYYVMAEYSTEDEANSLSESLEVNKNSTIYTAPIPITHNVVIKAMAVKQGMQNSEVSVLIYNYSAWQKLLEAIEYGTNVLERAQNLDTQTDNPVDIDQFVDELQWMLDEGRHFYYERGMMDSFEAEHFTERIMEIASEIEDMIRSSSVQPNPEPYAVLSNNNTVLTFYYDENREERNGMSVGPFDWKTVDNTVYRETDWYEYRESITNVVFDASFANYTTLTSTAWWFYQCENLTTITDINNLKTDNVTDMCYMFFRCRNLTGLDVSGFKTDNVTDMQCMFGYCTSLTSLDVSGFNTENVTNMRSMFGYCSNVSSLDVSNFNTVNVTKMSGMFDFCNSLTSLDLSNFDTANVTDMYAMFQNSSMESLDLSSFNTSNVTDMGGMFNNCSHMRTIYVGNGWSTAKVSSSDIMFGACTSLVGGAGTHFDSNHTDYVYAHIDGGTANPGYLTDIDLGPWIEPEPYAVLSNNNTVLTFYYDKNKEQLRGMNVGPFSTYGDRGWSNATETITTVVFDASFANCTTITSTKCWFYDFTNLTTITGLEYLNTSNVTDMSEMFRSATSLTSLDLSHFDTSSVTDMEAMFNGCSSLTTLNVTSFNTSNVAQMAGMFNYCHALESLDVSGFNTENVRDMSYMFIDDNSLLSLDLSSFNTSNVTQMGGMFAYCYNLKTIFVSEKWSTASVTSGGDMFTRCNSLVGGAGTHYDENHVDYTYAHIDGGTANPGYLTDIKLGPWVEPEPYAVLSDSNTVLTFYYDGKKTAFRESMSVGPFSLSYNQDRQRNIVNSGWDEYRETITNVVFDPSFVNCTTLTSTAYWFFGMENLTSTTGITNLNTSNVTNMMDMFYNCSSLTSLDVSNFNTTNVTNMTGMFDGCSGLTSLDLSNFNTANVTNMMVMFGACSGLTSLDLSNFSTADVTSMFDMFSGCSGLTTIYVGNGWSTSNVTEVEEVFSGCTALIGGAGTHYSQDHIDITYAHIDGGTANPGYLTDIKLGPWIEPEPYAVLSDNNIVLTFYYDGKKEQRNGMSIRPFEWITDNGWYEQRESITNAVFDESFANCTTLTSTAWWFYGCNKLTSIIGISNLKTDNVTNMNRMFAGCSGLTSLDVSGLKTDNVTNMSVMFAGCSSLTSLDVNGFKTDNVTDMGGMFEGCSGLTSLDLSGFKTDKVTNMSALFIRCSGLRRLDLSGFNTAQLTDMSGMFYGCSGLISLDLSGFNTTNVKDMSGMFYGCSSLAAIQAGKAALPDSIYAQVANPNLLVYVNDASLAPQGIQNIVVDGVAQEIVLTDVTEGNNNWYCPQAFTAEKISYTRDFQQQTEIDVSRGWEGIALPFTVQTITHETQGQISPFGAQDNDMKKFWLRGYSPNGLYNASTIEANMPYVISMPNNMKAYPEEYNLNGRVTFAANTTIVPATPAIADMTITRGDISMTANFLLTPQNDMVYAINVGQPRDRYAEGSVFTRGLRDVRPFEVYTVHATNNGARSNYIRISAQPRGNSTGIQSPTVNSPQSTDKWYDMNGRRIPTDSRLLTPDTFKKGIYIKNGKKVVK